MPELPDILLYQYALRARVVGHQVTCVRLAAPFLLRSVEPPIAAAERRTVVDIERLGKRVVFAFEGDLFVVVHLMIAGRFKWRPPKAPVPRRLGLLAMDFDHGTLLLTEAGSTRRASLHVVDGRHRLAALDPGGLEVLEADAGAFSVALRRENHTLKRALTDPHIFSGIGNAYSDEILHAARLSPFKLTHAITDAEAQRLFSATQRTLNEWIARLREDACDAFPEKVTAFRPEMAVHGRYGQPCPVCATPVQRIVYAANEANYCPACQTDGRLLADRSLSRLLREDWPRTLDELERRRERLAPAAPAVGRQGTK
jgi:formamidopyrimidine-DNA glycosylase